MIKWFPLLAIILLTSTVYGQVKSVQIISLPLMMETDQDIPCNNNFDKIFPEEQLLKSIEDQKMLETFKQLLLKFKKEHRNSIDVRGQIVIIFYKNKKRMICFDSFGFSENGIYFKNKELFNFLKANHLIRDFIR